MRLTKSFIERLSTPRLHGPGKPRQKIYRDDALPGFGLRITSGGARSYIVEKRVNGINRRVTIGRYGQITLEQARNKAFSVLGDMIQGIDPLEANHDRNIKNITILECYNDYLKLRHNLTPTTIADYARSINGALKDWRNKPLIKITKTMITERHQRLGLRSQARANNTMRLLRALFNFAIHAYEDKEGQPILQVNPVTVLSHCRAWYRSNRRQTLIKTHQLAAWYAATLQLCNETSRDYLHFLLLTGLRRSEAARLKWCDVDFIEQSFTIPDTKNKRPHTLPLSNFLHTLLKRRSHTKENEYVFPGKTEKGHLIDPKAAVTKVCDLSNVDFTLHDLRRTFITVAERLEIPAYALKRLLNHKSPNDVTAGYIIMDIERLRSPMQQITDHLIQAMHGSSEISILTQSSGPYRKL